MTLGPCRPRQYPEIVRPLPSLLDNCARAFGILALCLLSSPTWAASGGPDAFGYTWADSNSGGPAYAYVVNNGASDLGLSDDDSAVVAIGFPFEFYGQTYTQVTVHSNGGLSFGNTSSLSTSNACPLLPAVRPCRRRIRKMLVRLVTSTSPRSR